MRCCIGLKSAGDLELERATELTLIGLTGIQEIQVDDDLAAAAELVMGKTEPSGSLWS